MSASPRLSDIDLSRQHFDELCAWIDGHLDESIGWQQLLESSTLDFQAIQVLFYKHASTTPMTWIRKRRTQKVGGIAAVRSTLTLKRHN